MSVSLGVVPAVLADWLPVAPETLPGWVYQLLPHVVIGLFVFAFGACLGSFVNVLVHRLPAGISVVSPPSRCPRCGSLLGWRENLPVLGWLLLRGRCRTCREPISPHYPGVEALVGGLCTLLYLAYFASGAFAPWWGEIGGAWFAYAGPIRALPVFTLHCILIAALVAMTLIDARLSIVTLEIPVAVTVLALLIWPVQGLLVEWNPSWLPFSVRRLDDVPLPLPGWAGLLAAVGAALGLVLSMVLVRRGAIPDSVEEIEIDLDAPLSPLVWTLLVLPVAIGLVAGGLATRSPVLVAAGVAVVAIALMAGVVGVWRQSALPPSAVSASGVTPSTVGPPEPGDADEGWDDAAPPPRDYREALRIVRGELVFLLPALFGAAIGWWAGSALAESIGAAPPLALACFGGSLLGYLVGGGVIWAIRLAGTAGFGREAMGLGDVHLLAAVGAVLGWIDPLAGVVLATASGIVWAMLTGVILRRWGGLGSAMPFGPHLAVGCLLVIVLRPALEEFWRALTQAGTVIP